MFRGQAFIPGAHLCNGILAVCYDRYNYLAYSNIQHNFQSFLMKGCYSDPHCKSFCDFRSKPSQSFHEGRGCGFESLLQRDS